MNEGACATLIVAFIVAFGFGIVVATADQPTNSKIRSNIIIGIAYCVLVSAYTVCIIGPHDDEEEEETEFLLQSPMRFDQF